MAQLSTDTLVYSQIISKVQEFISKYAQSKINSPEDFDKEYKKLLSDIESSIAMPMTEIPLFHKGEIPSSSKMNRFTTDLSKDVNLIMQQFDSLVANYVNSFNKFTNEIESEKNFLSRIRSKIGALELYSNSAATNMVYFGDSLNNYDFIDTSKIRTGFMPDVSDGFACLPRKNVKKLSSSIKLANQNYNGEQGSQISYVDISNGLKGSYHLYFNDEQTGNPFLYERDNALLRSNELAMLDESPATYFEYEAINIMGASEKPDYEFQYGLSSNRVNQQYVNWGSFDTSSSLKMTIEIDMKNRNGEYINYISIVPFFGYDNIDYIKNIKISSIKMYNEKDNIITPLINETNQCYIGSDIAAPTLSVKNSYFYNKGVFRFEKVKASKVYITFEQPKFNDVVIKHAYWKPYESESLASTSSATWRGQERFMPSAIVSDNSNYRVEDVSWSKDVVVPYINRPTEIKSSTKTILPVTVKYWQQATKSYDSVKISLSSSENYYLSNDRVNNANIPIRVFVQNRSYAAKYEANAPYLTTLLSNLASESGKLSLILPENLDINSYINSLKKTITSIAAADLEATFESEAHGLEAGDRVFIVANISGSSAPVILKSVYNVLSVTDDSFTVSISSGEIEETPLVASFFIKEDIRPTVENLSIERFSDPADSQQSKNLFLAREFEYLKAKRASIGIRDVFIGLESYFEVAEIVSKPYSIYGNLELLSLQVEDYQPIEKNSDGEITGESSIRYYVSVDGGLKWIEISPQEKGFIGKPEVLAFNQNLSDVATLPQIAYFNSPDVPENITSVIFKAVMRKNRNLTSTPILYSYKIGMKVS
jgi:hypothetical protein